MWCFQNCNFKAPFNLYVPAKSNTLNTCLDTSQYGALVSDGVTWTNDTTNNRYYNTKHNIYIYPVANVAAARAANGD